MFSHNPIKEGCLLTLGGPHSSDQPLSVECTKHFSTSRFLRGDPRDEEKSYAEKGARPNPCNWIWGDGKIIKIGAVTKKALKILENRWDDDDWDCEFSLDRIGEGEWNFIRNGAKDIYGLHDYLNGNGSVRKTIVFELMDIMREDELVWLGKPPEAIVSWKKKTKE
jgi:hypothetical protein